MPMQFNLRAQVKRACRPLLFALALCAPAAQANGDAAFIAARDAFSAGNRQAFERHAAGLQSHVLASYIDYYRLRLDLDRASPDRVAAFLEQHAGTLVAQRLRSDWLRQLAKAEQWSDYRAEYALLPQSSPAPEADLRCHALRARLDAAEQAALADAKLLWATMDEPPSACVPVFAALFDAGRLTEDEVWLRARRHMELRRPGLARSTLALLPASAQPPSNALDDIVSNPTRWLDRQPANFSITRLGRELALMAIARRARSDVRGAERSLEVIAHRFIHYIPGGKFAFIAAREGGDVLFHFFLQRGFTDVTTIGVFKHFIVNLAVPYQGVAYHMQVVFGAECNKRIGILPIPLALGIAQYAPFHAIFWCN